MNIYLDDERQAPKGWLQVKTVEALVASLKKHKGKINTVSLDYHLGYGYPLTGLDAAYAIISLWETGYPLFDVTVHSDHPDSYKIKNAIFKYRRG
jgi:hypothetical protein